MPLELKNIFVGVGRASHTSRGKRRTPLCITAVLLHTPSLVVKDRFGGLGGRARAFAHLAYQQKAALCQSLELQCSLTTLDCFFVFESLFVFRRVLRLICTKKVPRCLGRGAQGMHEPGMKPKARQRPPPCPNRLRASRKIDHKLAKSSLFRRFAY